MLLSEPGAGREGDAESSHLSQLDGTRKRGDLDHHSPSRIRVVKETRKVWPSRRAGGTVTPTASSLPRSLHGPGTPRSESPRSSAFPRTAEPPTASAVGAPRVSSSSRRRGARGPRRRAGEGRGGRGRGCRPSRQGCAAGPVSSVRATTRRRGRGTRAGGPSTHGELPSDIRLSEASLDDRARASARARTNAGRRQGAGFPPAIAPDLGQRI